MHVIGLVNSITHPQNTGLFFMRMNTILRSEIFEGFQTRKQTDTVGGEAYGRA
jgi:hypothetical protein